MVLTRNSLGYKSRKVTVWKYVERQLEDGVVNRDGAVLYFACSIRQTVL